MKNRTYRVIEGVAGWHNAHDWIPDAGMNCKPKPREDDGTCRTIDRKRRGKPHVYLNGRCTGCGTTLG